VTDEVDKLVEAFKKQEILQRAIYGRAFDRPMRDATKEALLLGYFQAIVVEGVEGMKTMRFQPEWNRHRTDLEAAKGEVVDVFHYLVNAALVLWDGDADRFMRAYYDKWEKNYQRATHEAAVEHG